ncbi:MAG: putative porin [Gammaproteobacteria bacterium]|nr:putative porin [Gammaproteobacteria bacterium]
MKKLVLVVVAVFALMANWTTASADEPAWTERIAFSGDFRLRYEGIDEDLESRRDRARFRARFGLKADVADNVKVVIRLATGGDNPTSTNVTLDSGFSTKDIGLDLAYVDWTISDGFHFHGGKIKNPMFRAGGAPLIWDGDLNLEGFALKYDTGDFFATVGGYSVEERSSTDNSLLYAMQAGGKFAVGERGRLTAGAGYFAYTETVGNAAFFNGNARGNSLDANGDYLYDYENFEIFAQLDTQLGEWPLRVFAHGTQNNEVSEQDTAIAFGVKLGNAKEQGQSQYSWTYQDIEADSVVGTFNDSDFGGGGTDSKGHILRAKYGYSNKIFLGGTLFINEIDRFQGVEHDYSRIQLDVEFKFN